MNQFGQVSIERAGDSYKHIDTKEVFMIPDNLQKTLDDQRFLAFDVDIGSRMLGFCSHEGLFRLCMSYGVQLLPATIMTDFKDGAIQVSMLIATDT
ncbi:unnamed protein product [Didymodactylos carnosus]|uniref:Uncharacterized protein n=1 Tax=Didymodactylos carnosus TaxID=1234261 RepID=A0A814UIQ2_9BILA|nr:unnamed protein product [Didymodactylos carnosus]CAF1322102.1 unnamed protein product [Didymodactylos carnosus]CAF3940047.1 unnamed protein product [Didymodactylos carnosus]CAF4132397.1 unnamed protein product [Didymodactylos carnosus]